jgi:hypothetical protein
MGKGYFTAGTEGKKRNHNPARTDGARNGGNPPGCMTFVGLLLLLGLGVLILLAWVNLR